MTSTIKADVIEAATGTNTSLELRGKGSGVVNLSAGSTIGGAAFATSVNPNLIINGDMRIAQRGVVTGLTATGYGGADRFPLGITTIGTWTLQQTADGPDGFSSCQEAVCTTADASPAAGDALIMQHKFEGLNLQHLNYGSAQAETVTVSFWCKSDETGTVVAELYQADGPYQISQSFTIDVADTWEQKTLTFAGNTLGAITDDNTVGLLLNIWLDAGTNFTSGTLNTSWASSTNADRAAGLTLALADATSNYFRLTGVKLEVGSTATDFVPDDYGTAYAKCQRYYWRSAIITNGLVVNETQGTAHNASLARPEIVLGAAMRTKPTFGLSPAYSSGWAIHQVSGNFATTNGGGVIGSTPNNGSKYVIQIGMTGGVAYRQSYLLNSTGGDGYYELDAEL